MEEKPIHWWSALYYGGKKPHIQSYFCVLSTDLSLVVEEEFQKIEFSIRCHKSLYSMSPQDS